MSTRLCNVVTDAADPAALAGFWVELLGWRVSDADADVVSVVAPPDDGWRFDLDFIRTAGPKVGKNRVHLDVNAGGPRGAPDDERRTAVDAAVERALGLGAAKLRLVEERGERFYVMQDPEGNEFCILKHAATTTPWAPPPQS